MDWSRATKFNISRNVKSGIEIGRTACGTRIAKRRDNVNVHDCLIQIELNIIEYNQQPPFRSSFSKQKRRQTRVIRETTSPTTSSPTIWPQKSGHNKQPSRVLLRSPCLSSHNLHQDENSFHRRIYAKLKRTVILWRWWLPKPKRIQIKRTASQLNSNLKRGYL